MAASQNPDTPRLISQAIQLFDSGKADEARRLLGEAAEHDPANPHIHLVLGSINLNTDRQEDALANLDRSLELDASNPNAHCTRGVTLSTLGRHEEALDSLARTLQLAPRYAEAYLNRGTALRALHRLTEARTDFDAALRLKPTLVEAHYCRASLDAFQQRFATALEGFDRTLALAPGYVNAMVDKAAVLVELDRAAEALTLLDHVLTLAPTNFGARFGRCSALAELGHIDEALAAAQAIFEAKDGSDWDQPRADTYMSWLMTAAHRLDESIAYCERAAESPALRAEAYWKQSLSTLLAGRLREGFRLYEYRKEAPRVRHEHRSMPDPSWQGDTPIAGKRILVYREQGFGDAIQFVRYARLLSGAGAKVTLEAPPPLVRLFATLDGIDRLVATGDDPGPYDHHISLLSLPMAFGTELDTVPASAHYLAAEPERVHSWAERLGSRGRPRIGLVWQGSRTHMHDRRRSLQLSALLATLPRGPSYVSLQKEVSEPDQAALSQVGIANFADELTDFAETAALIENLDLVVTVDTSVAHLAGALGKPVFILLHYNPDWRWMLNRADSPWYPSARLFRQKRWGDWSDPLKELTRVIETDFDARSGEPVSGRPRDTIAAKVPISAPAERIRHAMEVFDKGDAAAARRVLANVVAQAPRDAQAHLVLGAVNLKTSQHADALADIDRSLAIDPSNPKAHGMQGVVLNILGRHNEAIESQTRALRLAPSYAEAYLNRGTALRALHRLAEAKADLDTALRLKPTLVEAHYGRALLDMSELNFDAALPGFDRALALAPGYVNAMVDKAAVLVELDRAAEALTLLDHVLTLAPTNFGARFNRCIALAELGHIDEALAAAQAIFEAKDGSDWDQPRADAYMAWLMAAALRLEESIAYCERAAQSPALRAEANWKQSFALLLAGRLRQGFRLYEYRKEAPGVRHGHRRMPDPSWQGDTPIAGKRILVYAEQGFGDAIQFGRYARLLSGAGAKVTLEAPPPLVRLFATLDGIDRLVATGDDPGPYDHHISLLSLPMAFGTELDTVPASAHYLAAEPERSLVWTERLGNLGRPRIGLVWQGNRVHLQDRKRSLPLSTLLAALPRGPGYVSLQKDVSEQDQAALRQAGIMDASADLTDFAETAALIENLDLVVTVDTGVAHLAGALGKPVFILLHYNPDWRWMLNSTDSPWYPSARLFRQKRYGDWSAALDELARAIAAIG